MAIYKNANLDISVAAEQNPSYNAKPSVQFSTQDKNTAKYTFTVKQNNKPVDLTGVAASVTLYSEDKSVFQSDATITSATEGKIEYVIPSEAIRHHGKTRGDLRLTYPNGDVLGGLRFSFNIEQALIDRAAGVVGGVYIRDFETLKAEIQKTADSIKDIDVVRIDTKLNELEEQIGEGVGVDEQARQQIEEVTTQLADTAKKSEARLKAEKLKLEDMSPETLAAIEGGEGTSFNLLSVPQNNSVSTEKLNEELKMILPIDTISGNQLGWELGTIGVAAPDTGKPTNSGNIKRIRTTEFLKVEKGTFRLENFTDFKMNIFIYSIDKKEYMSNTGFQAANYKITTPCYVKVLLAYKDDREITDPNTLYSLFRIDTAKKETVSVSRGNLNPDLKTLLVETKKPLDFSWRLGSLDFANGKEGASDNKTRIRTNDFIYMNKATIKLKNPIYKFAVYKYAYPTKRYIGWSEWKTTDEVIITEPCYIKLLVSHPDNREISTSEMNSLIQSLEIESYSSSSQEPAKTSKRFYDDVTGLYFADTLEEFPNPVEIQVPEVYRRYDALMAAFPKYITKKSLGVDESGIDVNQYTFTPHVLTNHTSLKPPIKIILTTGTHGDEKSPVYGAYNMFKEMCYNWDDNNILEFMRFNIQFILIPIVNPTGFNNHVRQNGNNVDLNRDYPENVDENMSNRALSTQYIAKVLRGNLDADFMIDFHNMYFRDGYLGYGLSHSNEINSMTNQLLNTMGRKWQKKYSFLPQEYDHQFGYTDKNELNRITGYAHQLGINSAIIEIVREVQWQPTWSQYDALTIKLATELLTNTMKGLVKLL